MRRRRQLRGRPLLLALLLLFAASAPPWSSSSTTTVVFVVVGAFEVSSLNGIRVASVPRRREGGGGKSDGAVSVDVGQWLKGGGGARKMVVFGTYAADFNAIEYGQRLRYYWPKLREKEEEKGRRGVGKCAFLLNCRPEAALELADLVDLPADVELWVDNTGAAGRRFGVGLGWIPDNPDVNPFLKLFGMLWGLGAWATLPAVIGGYIGNPFAGQPWIEDALAVGQRQGRWPDNALELAEDGSVAKNKFDSLPIVGTWPRRPLELATLRLQSMIGISLKNWDDLAPDDEALEAGVLTQLGGCLVVDADGESVLYEWRDPGICAVANFEHILRKV